ncbi:MAG: GTP-binding protein [Gammaproteobacteria bacterium]
MAILSPPVNGDLLRFITCGSVDDGKSTLIGRLLYDSKSTYDDQLHAIRRSTERRGGAGIDLALLTDGLSAEREQGITIDVAYRYFATPKRKFIIADCPGHEQYTRNMVTGASTAQLAIVLLDASKGVSPQARRHALIVHLLGIRQLVVAVNKMDLVEYSQAAFARIHEEFAAFCARLGVADIRFVPMAALHGDMVVERGTNLGWYQGPTLLEWLENVPIPSAEASSFRFPVQLISRPLPHLQGALRGYVGRVESGHVCVGDVVTALPSGLSSRIKEIITHDGRLELAHAGQPVTLVLEDELDISRGDMLVHDHALPRVEKTLEAQVCWMDSEPLTLGRRYLVKHTTRTVRAVISAVRHRIDVQTLEHAPAHDTMRLNDIGQIALKLQQPLVADSYRDNRATGSFIVIDETTHHTVGAGMIL